MQSVFSVRSLGDLTGYRDVSVLSVSSLVGLALGLMIGFAAFQTHAQTSSTPSQVKSTGKSAEVAKRNTGGGAKNPQANKTAGVHDAAHFANLPVLTNKQLELAQQVLLGQMPCELGASVLVQALPQAAGYFQIHLGKQRFVLAPVETSTGALRLEDPSTGAVWLQLANKSMMMNSQLGKRVVDECMSPSQTQVARAMEKNPPPSLLEPLSPPKILQNSFAQQDSPN
jgi:hypothetical protein